MTVETITKNWSEYDRKKKSQQLDSTRFDFNAEWEVSYLSGKISSIYPFIPEDLIKDCIRQCAQRQATPCSRQAFTEDVLRRLGIPL